MIIYLYLIIATTLVSADPLDLTAPTKTITLPDAPPFIVKVEGEEEFRESDSSIPGYLYNRIRVTRADSAYVAVHHDIGYDTNKISTRNAERYVQLFQNNGVPITSLILPSKEALDLILTEKPASSDDHLLRGVQGKDSFLYSGGYHQLQFHVNDLYMSGGELDHCFCGALRSVMIHSEVKRVHFLLDAIYSDFPVFWEQGGKIAKINDTYIPRADRKNMPTVPAGLKRLQEGDGLKHENLAKGLSGLSDSDLELFFQEGIFGNSSDGMPYCNGYPIIESVSRKYTVTFVKDGRVLGKVGKGDIPLEIDLDFDLKTSLEKAQAKSSGSSQVGSNLDSKGDGDAASESLGHQKTETTPAD